MIGKKFGSVFRNRRSFRGRGPLVLLNLHIVELQEVSDVDLRAKDESTFLIAYERDILPRSVKGFNPVSGRLVDGRAHKELWRDRESRQYDTGVGDVNLRVVVAFEKPLH
eukprot:12909852-Prorocentrum_lima.AAC.1